MMIQCKPKGLFSWDFVLDGDGHNASLDFNWVGEQGSMAVDGVSYEIRKHGMMSGHWTLDQDNTSVVSAKKSITRTFEIQNAQKTLLLEAESAFGRSFRLESSNEMIAQIVPAHLFTRRATIETFVENIDFPTISFAFWLTALTWRRSASSAGGAT